MQRSLEQLIPIFILNLLNPNRVSVGLLGQAKDPRGRTTVNAKRQRLVWCVKDTSPLTPVHATGQHQAEPGHWAGVHRQGHDPGAEGRAAVGDPVRHQPVACQGGGGEPPAQQLSAAGPSPGLRSAAHWLQSSPQREICLPSNFGTEPYGLPCAGLMSCLRNSSPDEVGSSCW